MAASKTELPRVILSPLDRLVYSLSPAAGTRRALAKLAFQNLQNSGLVSAGAAHTAGSTSKRFGRGWGTTTGDSNADDLPDLETIISRSRDLFRNSPLATGAIRRANTNAVGGGLQLQSRIRRDILGMQDDKADEWERDVEQRFQAYAESKLCDATRMQNFYELQGLAFQSMLVSGDVFALLPYIPRSGSESDLRIALYEADYVSNPNGAVDTETLAGGIEVDQNGAPKLYHFRKSHPGGLDMIKSNEWIPVKAYGNNTGRQNVIHLFKKERPGQRRGLPFLSPVVDKLKQLDRYTESELMAAVVTSFFTVFIKSQVQTQSILQEAVGADQKVTDPVNNPNDKNLIEMGSGNVVGLGDNEDAVFADPKRPNAGFDPFFVAIVRQIGACLEMPFEQLILHFTSSYSASRAALLEAWKFYRGRRKFVATNFCQVVFNEWLFGEIVAGRITAPGFMDNLYKRWAWQGAVWIGPGMGQIDPVKETKASQMKLDYNLSDFETEFAKGEEGDWEAAMNRKSHQEAILESKNLIIRAPGQAPAQEGDVNAPTNPPPEE
jgi:lambda family phage portal protein